jgi:DNA primase large subunit
MNISEEMSDMGKLSHENLYSLEEYARIRPEFRAQVMAHKKDRRVAIGEHAALYFEDALTMQYQVQEMLRIERIFEARGIQDELDVYNPLIPDGQNWKATFMMEYADVEQRRRELARLIGVDQALWVQVEGFDKVHPVANEDLERTTEDKTASVHFVRFELTPEMAAAAKGGAAIRAGISHPAYSAETVLDENVRNSLVGDLH